jgi:TorA maturation chaperone TorD
VSVSAPESEQARDLAPEQVARARLYALLGALLAREPDPPLLELLRGIEPGEGALAETWQALRDEALTATAEALAEEYQVLFIGLGRGELLPYGSQYLTGFLMERPLAALREALRELGLERQDGVHEPEDHAAALCEVMSVIIHDNRLSFLEEKAFFEAHLGSWLPRFFRDLETARSARFYGVVGRLGRRFMDIEQTYYAMPA